MGHRLDEIDHQIMDLLAVDGRMACTAIARAIGNISERSIRYRLEKLIELGYVRITAVLNPPAFGYPVAASLVIETETGLIQDVAQAVAGFDYVTYVACLASGAEISAQVVARDNSLLFTFVTEVIGKLPGVIRVTTAIIPQVIKTPGDWQLPADGNEKRGG